MTLKEMYEALLSKIASKSALGDKLTEQDVEQLAEWNTEAKQLEARIEAEGLAAKHAANETERIAAEQKKAVDDAVKAEREANAVKNRRLPSGAEAPYIAQYSDTYKYDQLDGTELSLVMDMSNKLKVPVQPGAYKAMSLRVAGLNLKDAKNEEERKGMAYIKNAFKAGTKIIPEMTEVEAAIKADAAPMYTGASPMSDWVGTFYSRDIWAKIRGAVVVASRMPSDVVPDGYASKVWPLESTDMTWYKVAEATAVDSTLRVPAATITGSAIGTGSKTISLGKMGARGIYTGEADEDSLIAFAPKLREQLEKSGAEQLEHVIVDGDIDTSPTTNINDIAGTPAGTETFQLFDGMRKLALVTNTANSRSAAGSLTIEDYKNTLKLLGVAGLAGSDPTKVAFVIDYNTMWATMDIEELKTRDVSSFATIENGMVTRLYRTDVLNSFQMHAVSAAAGYERKANTAGKVDLDTDANNTTGSILAVRFDQWKLAYKRRMTMEVTRLASSDSWEIVSLMRFGLGYRDTEASAITYNVGV